LHIKNQQEIMMDRLQRMITRLENSHVTFTGMLITFLSTLFLRNFLETFSDTDNYWTPVTSLAYFVHYPLFYCCLLVAVSIILARSTDEKIERVTKIVFLFFPLVLLAPILDLLVSQGKGLNMSYLFCDLSSLVRRFVPFYSGYEGKGATTGIQIELLVAFMASGIYVFSKTGKVIRAAVGVVAFYVVVFLLGATPSVTAILWKLGGSHLSPQEMFGGEIILYHFYSLNHKMALILFPILIGELCLWFWCYDRRKFLSVVRNLRGLRVIHYIAMLGFGMILGYSRTAGLSLVESPFPVLIITMSVLSGIFAWGYAVGINDIHDLEVDKISNRSRPLVSGILTAKEHRVITLLLLALSLIAACVVRYPFFISVLIVVGLSHVYSSPPLRLKRIPFLGKFIIAMCSTIVCLGGFVLFSDNYSFEGFPPKIMLTMLVTITLAFNVIDIKDIRGDRATGNKTLPVLFGDRRGKKMIGALVLVSYACIPLFLGLFSLIPVALVFGIASYLLIDRRQMREIPIFVLYFVFLGITMFYYYTQIQIGESTILG
jgi:4-hydroxybenzoate polyprenyltransferase